MNSQKNRSYFVLVIDCKKLTIARPANVPYVLIAAC